MPEEIKVLAAASENAIIKSGFATDIDYIRRAPSFRARMEVRSEEEHQSKERFYEDKDN